MHQHDQPVPTYPMNPTHSFEENQPVAGRLRPLGITHVPRDAAQPAQTLGCGDDFCLVFHRETNGTMAL